MKLFLSRKKYNYIKTYLIIGIIGIVILAILNILISLFIFLMDFIINGEIPMNYWK